MFMNLFLVSLSISDILEIDITVVISLVLHTNFAKIHTDSEAIISMILLFGRMFSLVKRFHKYHDPRNFTTLSIRN